MATTKISELNYPNAVTRDGRRKSWFIRGTVYQADSFCADCSDAMGIDPNDADNVGVIFASDGPFDCGNCGTEF